MSTFRLHEPLSLGAVVLCLAACGSSTAAINGASFPSARGFSGSTYKVSDGLLFIADSAEKKPPYDDVQIYDLREKGQPEIAHITNEVNQPQSVCIDNHKTLYVVNQVGWISEYAIGSTIAERVITSGIEQPAFCAIDSKGDLWVTNIGGQNATEYLPGATTPNKVISDGLPYPLGIAFDHHNNMYIANHGGGTETNLQVYSPGATSPSRTITDGVEWPVDIAVDTHGTLYVPNLSPGNIEEYHLGSSKPFRKITQDLDGPAAVTFSPSGWMYVSNYGAQGETTHGPPSTVLEFPPHSKVPSKKNITYPSVYLPLGTAFYPPSNIIESR